MASEHDVLISNNQLWRLSVTELSELLQQGELTPTVLLDALLQRIEELNPQLNAITALNPHALAEAQESERRLAEGRARSPLEGIPVVIKDNIHVQGMKTTWGSRVFQDSPVLEKDELPVKRLRRAGMVVLGKTNVPEFTLEGYTDNPVYGVTRNPWDTRLTPGGSSGGAVAAVAAGLVPCAIGTDGGGSIRRPASHTGLIGLKPSIGRVARDNGLPHIMLDFEVIGPVTRTVADSKLLYQTMVGPDVRDRNSLLSVTVPQKSPLRILYVPRFADNPLDPEIDINVAEAAERLRALGHEVIEGVLPFDLDFVDEFWPMLGSVAVGALFERYPGAEQLASAKFIDMAAVGKGISAPRYLDAIDRIDLFRKDVADAFKDIDIIMTPSAAALPWPAATPFPAEIDNQQVGPRGHAVYTGWVNACGHPAINLPAASSVAGLPIGFQLVGRFGADEQLLQIAEQYESALPEECLRPPIKPNSSEVQR
ncbi:MAG: amidase [Amphritea sp.]